LDRPQRNGRFCGVHKWPVSSCPPRTGASRLLARGPECNPEALDRPARAVEHTRADDLELPLAILGDRSLLFKHLTQLARHRERAPLAVLGLPWIEPHCARAEIALAPLERQDLAVDPPAGDGLLVTLGSNLDRLSCDEADRYRELVGTTTCPPPS